MSLRSVSNSLTFRIFYVWIAMNSKRHYNILWIWGEAVQYKPRHWFWFQLFWSPSGFLRSGNSVEMPLAAHRVQLMLSGELNNFGSRCLLMWWWLWQWYIHPIRSHGNSSPHYCTYNKQHNNTTPHHDTIIGEVDAGHWQVKNLSLVVFAHFCQDLRQGQQAWW